jgi:hypothetical protein
MPSEATILVLADKAAPHESALALTDSLPPQFGGGGKNGADDFVVAGAPAEVAASQ